MYDYEEDCKLTVTELRKFKGFEDISEEEGEKLIDALHQLTVICYEEFITNDLT
jgi:hypothetical protein